MTWVGGGKQAARTILGSIGHPSITWEPGTRMNRQDVLKEGVNIPEAGQNPDDFKAAGNR